MASLEEKWLLVSYSAQKKICQFRSSEPQGWNFKFDRISFSKRYTGWSKNCGRSFILWHWSVMANFGENWLLVSYSAQKKICEFRSSEPEVQNFKFDGMIFSKRYIGWAKNCDTSFMLWHWKAMESLGGKGLQVPNSPQEKICEFCSSEPEGRNFKFDGMVFPKSYIGWTKNCGRGFILWHWKAMESFGKKWLQVSNSAQKKFCEFCCSERVKISHLMGVVFLKGTLVQPKTVAGVSSYYTEKP